MIPKAPKSRLKAKARRVSLKEIDSLLKISADSDDISLCVWWGVAQNSLRVWYNKYAPICYMIESFPTLCSNKLLYLQKWFPQMYLILPLKTIHMLVFKSYTRQIFPKGVGATTFFSSSPFHNCAAIIENIHPLTDANHTFWWEGSIFRSFLLESINVLYIGFSNCWPWAALRASQPKDSLSNIPTK